MAGPIGHEHVTCLLRHAAETGSVRDHMGGRAASREAGGRHCHPKAIEQRLVDRHDMEGTHCASPTFFISHSSSSTSLSASSCSGVSETLSAAPDDVAGFGLPSAALPARLPLRTSERHSPRHQQGSRGSPRRAEYHSLVALRCHRRDGGGHRNCRCSCRCRSGPYRGSGCNLSKQKQTGST